MQLRSRVAILISGLLPALFSAGIVGDCVPSRAESRSPGEESLAVRRLQLDENGSWIGNAICYSPYRDGQRPGGVSPTVEQLREDLHLMLPHWNVLRTYGSSEYVEQLLTIIHDDEMDMRVMVGVWIAPDDSSANRREIEEAVRLANRFPSIVCAVCVGNETQVSWSGHRVPPEKLLESIRSVRARVRVPVTTADDYQYWILPESRIVADAVDFVTMHAHPLWNGILLADALPWFEDQVKAVQATHPTREIVIGETGWATSHSPSGEQGKLIKAKTGEEQQEQYCDAVRAWANARRRPTFLFEAFDENWKGGTDPAEVEKHWGLFRADRTPKAALH